MPPWKSFSCSCRQEARLTLEERLASRTIFALPLALWPTEASRLHVSLLDFCRGRTTSRRSDLSPQQVAAAAEQGSSPQTRKGGGTSYGSTELVGSACLILFQAVIANLNLTFHSLLRSLCFCNGGTVHASWNRSVDNETLRCCLNHFCRSWPKH